MKIHSHITRIGYRSLFTSAVAVCVLLTPFVFRPYAVTGSSMEPSFSHGDIVLIERITPLLGMSRGDVIVMRNPHQKDVTEIKRIVGLPTEHITLGENSVTAVGADGVARTYGAATSVGLPGTGFFEMQLGPEDYMVLGDNRSRSEDSRNFGAVQKPDVYGHVILKLYSSD